MTDDEERSFDTAVRMYDSLKFVLPRGPCSLTFYLPNEVIEFRRGYDQHVHIIMRTRKQARFRSTATINTKRLHYHRRYDDDHERLALRWERAEHAFKRRLGLISVANEIAN